MQIELELTANQRPQMERWTPWTGMNGETRSVKFSKASLAAAAVPDFYSSGSGAAKQVDNSGGFQLCASWLLCYDVAFSFSIILRKSDAFKHRNSGKRP